ncbi:HU family DNA-binding protein, partial [Arhodomonas sp. KWT]
KPQTGESIRIAASRVPAFRPGKGFKDQVNGG